MHGGKGNPYRTIWLLIAPALLAPLLAGCAALLGDSRTEPHRPKNIILLIGDGMGPQQLSLLSLYSRRAPSGPHAPSHIEEFLARGATSLMLTAPRGALVNDSACVATHLAAGVECVPGAIGVDIAGAPARTILERARDRGMATGLVTDTRITHATPAAFAAHVASRNDESDIASELLKTRPDLMLSAGLRYFLPAGVEEPTHPSHEEWRRAIPFGISLISRRRDHRNLLAEASEAGYSLAFSGEDLAQRNSLPILGLFAPSAMPNAIDERRHVHNGDTSVPTLREMTEKALSLLSGDPDGFFLMVEGGQIDWAAHVNDAGWLLHELLRFDEVVGTVLNWSSARNDTLVILTADHETGSFGFSYSGADLEEYQQRVGAPLAFNYGDISTLDKLLHQRATFRSVITEFEGLPRARQTPERLRTMINEVSEFEISYGEALEILATEPNRYYTEGHRELGLRHVPKINDFTAFYPDGAENRSALVARMLADEQGIVWGTGTHTATPVPLVAIVPPHMSWPLQGMVLSPEVGRFLSTLIEERAD